MIQEEKQILLTDLCARVPYGVKIHVTYTNNEYDEAIYGIVKNEYDIPIVNPCENDIDKGLKLEQVKPYLRPMSSMTKNERLEISDFTSFIYKDYHQEETYSVVYQHMIDKYIDYLNSHFFDWRGLIPMGLALEAKEGMYNIE